MLDPSSSEEDDSDREVTQPARRLPATPGTSSIAVQQNHTAIAVGGSTSTPGRRRTEYAEDDTRSSDSYAVSGGGGGAVNVAHGGGGRAATWNSVGPSISIDQRSLSAASRASYDENVDSVSIQGGAMTNSHNVNNQGQAPNAHYHRPSTTSLPAPPCSPGGMSSSSDRDMYAVAATVDPEQEEEERRRKLQLYVFVIRCIAYPFNAKQPTDMIRRQTKVTKQQLQSLKDKFQVESLLTYFLQS